MNKFTYRSDISVDKDLFKHQPNIVSAYFFLDADNSGVFDLLTNEISLDVCDSHYAIMTTDQMIKWAKLFANTSKEQAENSYQYMTLTISWKIGKVQEFVMVIDEGHLTFAFAEFCDKLGIDSQFHIDNPSCKTDDYEYTDEEGEDLDPEECWNNDEWIDDNVYTGAGENFPHLIRKLHEIQENK